MYQRILQIEQHPFAAFFAFDANRLVPGLLGFFGNVVDQRLNMPVRCAARNDHVISHGRHISHIECRYVLRLDVIERIDDQRAQLLAIHA